VVGPLVSKLDGFGIDLTLFECYETFGNQTWLLNDTNYNPFLVL
jgi:hypothetical protein